MLILASCMSSAIQAQSLREGYRQGGATSQSTSIDSTDCLFDPSFQVRTVSILSKEEAQEKNAPLALVRNPNGKLAIMSKDVHGELQPFYMRGIEYGFWDMRKAEADYDKVFADCDRAHWMTAEEAKEYGMIDQVLIKK